MGYKKLIIIAIFLIAHVMLFSRTYCEAKTLNEVKREIRNDLCPNGKVKMQRVVNKDSKFSWKKPNETVLLFPAQQNFPDPGLATMMDNQKTKDYACDLLRLIPPSARTRKFLELYKDAILAAKGTEKQVTTPIVYQAFKAFEGCCIPLDMGKTAVPETYEALSSLITDPNKYEEPPAADLLSAPAAD